MNIIKRAAVMAGAATVGFVAGAISVPVHMVLDVLAPITYPIGGTALGALLANVSMKDESIGAVIGLAGGVAAIPIAPFNFISRPVVMPVGLAAQAAWIAHQQTK